MAANMIFTNIMILQNLITFFFKSKYFFRVNFNDLDKFIKVKAQNNNNKKKMKKEIHLI